MLKILLLVILVISRCQAEAFWWDNVKAIKLTDDNYKDIIGKDEYVFVDFYIKTCPHCEDLYPTINKLIEETKSGAFPRKDILFAKIDGQENRELVNKFGVSQYPTLFLFKPNFSNYPEKYIYSRTQNHIKNYLLSHVVAPKYSSGS